MEVHGLLLEIKQSLRDMDSRMQDMELTVQAVQSQLEDVTGRLKQVDGSVEGIRENVGTMAETSRRLDKHSWMLDTIGNLMRGPRFLTGGFGNGNKSLTSDVEEEDDQER